jgi:uncharacterized membrane protein
MKLITKFRNLSRSQIAALTFIGWGGGVILRIYGHSLMALAFLAFSTLLFFIAVPYRNPEYSKNNQNKIEDNHEY